MGCWEEAGIGISSWIFLRDGKPAVNKPLSQNGLLSGMCGGCWKRPVSSTLRPETLIRIPFRTYLVFFIWTVLRTITQLWNSLQVPWRLVSSMALLLQMRNTNCEDDKTELPDNLHSFLEYDPSLPHPSTNHNTGTDGAVPIHVAEHVQHEVLNCDMKLLSVSCQWFLAVVWHQLWWLHVSHLKCS